MEQVHTKREVWEEEGKTANWFYYKDGNERKRLRGRPRMQWSETYFLTDVKMYTLRFMTITFA